MPDTKKKPSDPNMKMRIIYLIFITLLLIIIIFATSLLLSGKNNDDTVKGESSVNTRPVTTTVSEATETVTETVPMITSALQTTNVSSAVSSATTTSGTVTTTAVSTTVRPATVKAPQNVPVPQAIPSPRPAVSPTRPHTDSVNPPETITTTTITTTVTTVPSSLIKLSFYEYTMKVGDESVQPWVTMDDSITDKSEKWESSDESVAVVDEWGTITPVGNGVCTIKVSSVSNPEVFAEVKITVGDVLPSASAPENTEPTESTTDSTPDEPTYIGGILIANKSYALPEDYNPGLDTETESAFNELSESAAEEGLDIYLSSGFRSYETQDRIYNNYVDSYGQESADTFSARPGHSEHQTGLAIDVNTIDDSFAGTPEAIWLENHAHEYGFIIRYPKGKEDITGYKYEPWHIRYLGIEKATEVYNSGLTLEEFLGIDSQYKE